MTPEIKVGDIFSYRNQPKWVIYDEIFFIVLDVNIDVYRSRIVMRNKQKLNIGEIAEIRLSDQDIDHISFDPYIITDQALKAKILLLLE